MTNAHFTPAVLSDEALRATLSAPRSLAGQVRRLMIGEVLSALDGHRFDSPNQHHAAIVWTTEAVQAGHTAKALSHRLDRREVRALFHDFAVSHA